PPSSPPHPSAAAAMTTSSDRILRAYSNAGRSYAARMRLALALVVLVCGCTAAPGPDRGMDAASDAAIAIDANARCTTFCGDSCTLTLLPSCACLSLCAGAETKCPAALDDFATCIERASGDAGCQSGPMCTDEANAVIDCLSMFDAAGFPDAG